MTLLSLLSPCCLAVHTSEWVLVMTGNLKESLEHCRWLYGGIRTRCICWFELGESLGKVNLSLYLAVNSKLSFCDYIIAYIMLSLGRRIMYPVAWLTSPSLSHAFATVVLCSALPKVWESGIFFHYIPWWNATCRRKMSINFSFSLKTIEIGQ